MFYFLVSLKKFSGAFNIFHYITFRAAGAAVTSLALSLVLGPSFIRFLRKKKLGQIQRKEGPTSHLSKHGTPTMGGVLIYFCVSVSALLWMRPDDRFTWLMLGASTAFAAIGFWDDYVKLSFLNPSGISSQTKFIFQALSALLVVFYLAVNPPNSQYSMILSVPYSKELFINLGSFYFVLATLMIVGSSNSVNLTDGLDGLATGVLILCAITYGFFAYVAGNIKFASYLRIIHVEGAGEIAVYLSSIVGGGLGFLWFNSYPAEIFMGDTGSLFLGGMIAVVALCVKQELVLPIAGGLFVIETLSVILQMGSYKIRKGKRLFKMAPIHHHFELTGIAESKVTVRFWIMGIVLMLVALASLKMR
jgi:phospho-N-acetylmuramoyl-pentapeptide-transferase